MAPASMRGSSVAVMARRRSRRAAMPSPALALALAALYWSGNFIVGRAIRDDTDPLLLNFCRWSIAFVLLIPVVSDQARAGFAAACREWRLVLGLGATGIVG